LNEKGDVKGKNNNHYVEIPWLGMKMKLQNKKKCTRSIIMAG